MGVNEKGYALKVEPVAAPTNLGMTQQHTVQSGPVSAFDRWLVRKLLATLGNPPFAMRL